ncbi:2-amino-4-hydroxy-6-hydroxymethyldihydropteridine diphosphokinase [Pararhizobium capsulatum DSM 1112]|uniref:2-amino-4-hydroxy-6-hydroxymethyldihydropteridine pyrophosphokinase n=1 Tax=Pararhizobium capsulatum DSM 1112 TaxID=1121113 RepID=A0ABU0BQJ2_9HYPH|nr:2-amino-4-hydroxy-6-hydroxymethyldihydropteridine diphosphokinase [Pararhizobium capsulatum]MDQ0320518.1 2-amino-4-hydroxy-6-hydroxymethyldihydropteridine diphosphokinase [Pararhizobium capsulatum DSM 1112]
MRDSVNHWAALGLGGNIGDAKVSIARALVLLDARPDCDVIAVSRLYRTPPWGKTDQAWFFNACAAVSTQLSPEALLQTCLSIERDMKRERLERWGPRTIDIDVLAYDGIKQSDTQLEIPHPRMTARGFVLMPLADFAPGLEVEGCTVANWLANTDTTGIEVADDDLGWWRKY